MIQPRRGPRLAERPLTEIPVLLGDENLFDRHFAIQDLVVAPPDKAHPALSQEPGKPVPASDQALRLVAHAAMVAAPESGGKHRATAAGRVPGSPFARQGLIAGTGRVTCIGGRGAQEPR